MLEKKVRNFVTKPWRRGVPGFGRGGACLMDLSLSRGRELLNSLLLPSVKDNKVHRILGIYLSLNHYRNVSIMDRVLEKVGI